MKETFEIEAVTRSDEGKGASRRLRREGLVPGIIYGGGKDPEMVATAHNTLAQNLEQEAFYTHILTVNVDGNEQKVVLKDLQRHPAKPFILHFDLLRVSDTDRIKMTVPLHFTGEDVAPGAKMGGNFVHNITEVEIICQAKDLPEFIDVDVSVMEIGDALQLTGLALPEGVEILVLTHGDDYDAPVVSVQAARGGSEEEEEAGEEEVAAEEGTEEAAEE